MPTGTIVSGWKDVVNGYLAVRVEGDGPLLIEYIGTTSLLDEEGNPKTVAQLKAECVADVKVRRAAQLFRPVVMPVTGTVLL